MKAAYRSLVIGFILSLVAQGVQAQESALPPADKGSAQLLAGTQREAARRNRELRRQAVRNISQKRYPLAIQNLRELVSIDPYEADYHISLGVLYVKTRNNSEARRKYQDFIDLGGNLAVAHLLIAETYIGAGDREAAYEHLRRAAENGINLMKAASESQTLDAYREDTEFIKLALQLEQYQLDLVSKRDPMTQVFRRAGPTEDASSTEVVQSNRLGKEEQEKILMGAKRCLIRIELFLSREDEERAMEAYKELQGYVEQSDMITVPLLASEFRSIVVQKDQIEQRIKTIRVKYYYGIARDSVAQMQSAFANRDYAQVELAHAEVRKIAEKMLGVDSEFQEVSELVLRVADDWMGRARIRQEFDGKTIDVQGIVCSSGTKIVILNNKVLRVGQRFGELRVLSIDRNQVVFNFKGEQIPVAFHQY